MSNEQLPKEFSRTLVLNSPELADALRMVRAIKIFAKSHQKNQHIQSQVAAACIMLKRVETQNQLDYCCEQLRDLLAMFLEREVNYERVLSDFAQSERRTGVRYSDTVGGRGGNMDNSNIGPPSVPVPEMEAERPERAVRPVREPDSSGLAGSLPKRKGRKSRAKPKRSLVSSDVYSTEVPKKSLT